MGEGRAQRVDDTRRGRRRSGAVLGLLFAVALLVGVALAGGAFGHRSVEPIAAPSPVRQSASPSPVVAAAPSRVALVIGDSQVHGAGGVPSGATWVRQGFAALGYDVEVRGAGGTGFVRGSSGAANYPDAYVRGDWTLPASAALVVVEGGGNDRDAADADIAAGAERLLDAVASDYPDAELLVIGPIGDGDGRRAEVSDILEDVASKRGLAFLDTSDWRSRYGLAAQLSADGVHFTQAGHDAAAPVLERALRTIGVPEAPSPAPAD